MSLYIYLNGAFTLSMTVDHADYATLCFIFRVISKIIFHAISSHMAVALLSYIIIILETCMIV